MGDAAGVGPEVIVRAWAEPVVHEICRPVVLGHPEILRQAIKLLGGGQQVETVANLDSSVLRPTLDTLVCMPVGSDDLLEVPAGTVDARTLPTKPWCKPSTKP